MSEIRFKATRRLHDSGFRVLRKEGDLQYDLDSSSNDGVWIDVLKPGRVLVDCNKQGVYRLVFDGEKVRKQYEPEKQT